MPSMFTLSFRVARAMAENPRLSEKADASCGVETVLEDDRATRDTAAVALVNHIVRAQQVPMLDSGGNATQVHDPPSQLTPTLWRGIRQKYYSSKSYRDQINIFIFFFII